LNPLVYSPAWTKAQLWEASLEYVYNLCGKEGINFPLIKAQPPPHARRFGSGGTFFGLFGPPNRIWVNVDLSTKPPIKKGRIWSYPGHRVDRTCSGILLHEFSHYIWYLRLRLRSDARRDWKALVTATRPVSGYECQTSDTPFGAEEAWAETVRVFLSNPSLLSAARPRRFAFIAKHVSVPHSTPWPQVLGNAPSFILGAAQNFTKEKEDVRRKLV
jgi:hypothetical protein